jgi:hypothetical protein
MGFLFLEMRFEAGFIISRRIDGFSNPVLGSEIICIVSSLETYVIPSSEPQHGFVPLSPVLGKMIGGS